MKLKKLLKVLQHNQPIRVIVFKGENVYRDNIQYWDEFYKPLHPSIAEFQVTNVRHVHDSLQIPDFQDFIEISLEDGGN